MGLGSNVYVVKVRRNIQVPIIERSLFRNKAEISAFMVY